MNETELQILLIEDDPEDALLVKHAIGLVVTKMNVHWSETMEMALQAMREKDFDVILVDLSLPDCELFDSVKILSQVAKDKPIIVVTGLDDFEVANSILEAGAQDYVVKGKTNELQLERSIRYAIQRNNYVVKNRELAKELAEKHSLLTRKNDQLAKLYAQAHEFVDNVSHEFRTPLTVIKEYVSLVREGIMGPINDEQTRMLSISEDRVEDLNIMVDDMLDTSKLEAGMLGASRIRCDIEEAFERVRPWLKRKSAIKNIEMTWNIDPEIPKIYCDPEKVSRIVTNLAINAVKFCGSPGKISISAKHVPDQNEIAVSISDNGPGLDEESRKKIFARFQQLDSSVHNSTKGFGLGLSITKQLVDLNFGKLNVESEVGHGSSFTFTLPVDDPTEILGRYINSIKQLSRDESNLDTVSIIKGVVNESTDDASTKDIGVFLNCCLRKHDLLLQTKQNQWLIALPELPSELDAYFTRVEHERTQLNRNRPYCKIPKFALSQVESISIQATVEETRANVIRLITANGSNENDCSKGIFEAAF